MSWLLTLLGFMVAASATAPHSLVQERWQRLPLGAIRPKGWLLTQMTLHLGLLVFLNATSDQNEVLSR